LSVATAMSWSSVRATRKLAKLFSADAVHSLSEHATRWMHPVSAKKIRATVDQAALDRLREKYPRSPGSPKINQFEDADYWIRINLKRVQDLWLDRSSPMRILDLGCGSGFFLYICKLFGHDVVGLDRDTNPMFRAIVELLGVPRVDSDIEPNVPLSGLGPPFDLVTAYRICFQRISTDKKGVWREWGPAEWQFFLNDIRTRVLRPRGRLLLDFNPRDDGSYFHPEVRELFESEGARFFRSKVLFAATRKEQPKFKILETIDSCESVLTK
jgi:SAM-dependent methyltransferase